MKAWMMAVVVASVAVLAVGSGAALAVEKKAPEPGTWEYQLALETGTLPASGQAKAKDASARKDAQGSVIEVGGQFYRLGIDTK